MIKNWWIIIDTAYSDYARFPLLFFFCSRVQFRIPHCISHYIFFFFWSFLGGSVFLMALTFWKILASYSVESPLIWFVCCLLMISLRLYIFDKTMTIAMCLSLYVTSENTIWTRFITADKILPLVKVMWWGSSTVKLLLFFIYFIF